MKSCQQQSEKQMNFSGFRPNLMKQSSMDMMQTQISNSFSDDDQESVFGTQQECLIKLMQQRKKIEELSYLHQKAVDQLKKQEDKVKKFQSQQQTFEELKTIKVKYLTLGKQFEVLMGEKALTQGQNEKLRENLSQLSKQHQKLIKLSQLKQMRKDEQNNLQVNRYEQLLKDKDDEIRRNIDVYEIKQKQYEQQIHSMNDVMEEMKAQIMEMKRNHDKEINQLTNEIVKRDNGLERMKKIIDNIKEENTQLRKQVKQLDTQFMAKEKQWLSAQDQLIFEINTQKRKAVDLENALNNTQYERQKLQQKLANQKNATQNLKQQLKQLQQHSTIQIDQLTHSFEQKILQQKHQIQELKQSVEELLEVKDIFNKQNDMLKDQIQKDQEQKRKRNLIMRSELRQIQKIENSVKKVL